VQAFWDHVEVATQDASQPWHWPALATVEQGEPRVRTIVLRAINRAERSLIAQVHGASPKVAQLERQPQAEWLFYDPNLRIQVRARGQTTLHRDDPLANDRWQSLPKAGRKMYQGEFPPSSSRLTNGQSSSNHCQPSPFLDARTNDAEKGPQDPNRGRDNFCVLETQVDRIDWYDLRPADQIRWLFKWQNSSWQAQPLVP